MDLHLPYLTFAYLHISLYTASLVCVSKVHTCIGMPPTFIKSINTATTLTVRSI